MTDISPGWYKDPADPTTQRYWDGEGWIGHALPADVPAPSGPPPAETPPLPLPPAQAAPDGVPPGAANPQGAAGPLAESGARGAAGPPPVAHPGPGLPPIAGAPDGAGPPQGHPAAGPPPGWPAAAPPGPAGAPPVRADAVYHYPIRMPAIRPHGLALATPGARLVARLIDIGVLALLNLVVNGWFIWQYAAEVAPTVAAWKRYLTDQSNELPENTPRSGYLQIVIILIAAALWLAYEVPAVANTGQTLGKRVLGIQVVRVEAPGPIGFARSLRRWNTLGLPTLLWPCCGIGFVLQFIDAGYVLVDRLAQQALHDKSARTVVVRLSTHDKPDEPAGSDQPAGSSEPAGSDQPAGSSEPAGSDQPAGSSEPAGPDQPRRDEQTDTPGGPA